MTPLLLLKILLGFLGFIILGFIYTFYWLMKNNLKINITLIKEGTPYSVSTRVRIHKNEYYPIKDLFTRKPLRNITYSKTKDCIMINEGFPFIGVKKVLFLKADCELIDVPEDKIFDEIYTYKPFFPEPLDIKEVKITDTMISWLYTSKKELFDATEPKMSREQILRDFVLPMGLVILSVMVLIFFPKIYMAIKAASSEQVSMATSKITDAVTRFIPLG